MTKKIVLPPQEGTPAVNEGIKKESNYLRGTLKESMKDPLTGSIGAADQNLIKFHGSYMQDNRDERDERQRKKLEPSYQFMIRVRTPGGAATSEQWLMMDEMARTYGNGTLKITTRQAFQLHGILKWNVKAYMQEMNRVLLDSLAACGDVNRNVMCNVIPTTSKIHEEVYQWSVKVSEHLLPKTQAYHEIWLDGEKVHDTPQVEEVEPIYGELYLPRKFKIGIAIPPSNDTDVYSQDIGIIAIVEDNELKGFNITVGGGMGMTHGDDETYPQLGHLIGFVTPEQLLVTTEKIVTIQRDFGNRIERKNARFKYTIDRYGIEWFKEELHKRLGFELEEARQFHFERTGDEYGWVKGENGNWHFTLFVQGGRVKDFEDYPLMTGLREIAKVHEGRFFMTPNQNLVISDITPTKKRKIQSLITKYKLTDGKHYSALRRNSIACVSLPTCGLAMAEAERYLPSLITKIEEILDESGLHEQEINIRMSGCPNGCSRAAIGEIGFIGKGPGKYNMYLGAAFNGSRLNKIYKENVDEATILQELRTIIPQYAKERLEGEHFGDFVIRANYVEATTDGTNFHTKSSVLR
ncbi:assimilatory sulfite reductase (NADPH) hemoprotein subunit [Kurthia sp. YJT4]|uniref:assimilatory sulfite reductase (NADPH) hemoprotein subunit n=1 Tax=Kurthia TaxID=1649 RepID=UPI0008380AF0|nr:MULTISPECIES: assimilatory sulfite reductase (NADPH) hemoprotein subunit [Kurthia]MEB6112060.1 assimilatory sulfite reductase (NADPH) hemoprotein subunit [Kurthia gibsonii]WIL37373.1 assimilatory sulfite reductase (NADPH) hemoprotein subunit [Kurthia sp. YJT4]